MIDNYQSYDDLELYDSVIESLEINHKRKTISFRLLKVISKLDRNEGRNFTYKVKQGTLSFDGVIFANLPYNMEIGEWSEFYRSALLTSSTLIERFKYKTNQELKHIYLGIDNGNEFNKIDIVCSSYKIELEAEEFILHDDFDWLYKE